MTRIIWLICITSLFCSLQLAAQTEGFYRSKKFQRLVNNIQQKYNAIATVDVKSDTTGVERFAVGEELFITTQLGDYLYGEMLALKNPSNVRFSLSSFVEILDFPINIEYEPLSANGWYAKEENLFELSMADQTDLLVTIGNEQFVVPTDSYEINEEDIYIDADTLSVWFDIKMSFDFTDLLVIMAPREPLPVQLRLIRQNRDLNRNQRNPLPVLPPKENQDYSAVSPQTLDAQISANYSNSDIRGLYSLQGGRDLAWFHSNFFLTGTDEDLLTASRLVFSRESAEKDLLGPLGVARVEFGDITGARIGGGSTSAQSRGLSLTNVSPNSLNDIEFTNLAGEIAPDWDVELYRNGVLLDQRVAVQSGRYEFNDVPLLFGTNDFELIFYGPQGEVRTEQRQFIIEGNLLNNNEFQYNVTVEDVGESFLNIGNNDDTNNLNLGYRATGRYNYGINQNLSIRFGHTNQFSGVSDANTWSLGGNWTLNDNLLLGSDISYTDTGTQSINFTGRTNLYGQSTNLSYQFAQIDINENETQTQSDLQFTVAGPIWRDRSSQIGHSTRVDLRREFDGDKFNSLSTNLAMRFPGFSLNTNLDYTHFESSTESSDSLVGGISAQTNFSNVFTRFQVNYSLLENTKLLSAGTQLSWNLTDILKSRLNLDYDFDQDVTRIRWQTNLRRDKYNLAGTISYDDLNKLSVSLQTRFSYGYTNNGAGSFFSNKELSNRGSLVVRVFHDINGNGLYEEGEPLLEGVDVDAKQIYGTATTNKKGVAVLAALSTSKSTDIELDIGTLPDAFMIPAIPGVSITPRPGFVDTFDFPVVYGSDVEGIVSIVSAGQESRAAPYARMELLDNGGNILRTVEAEYDGYYLFTEVQPGSYSVRVAPDYIEQRGLKNPKAIPVVLGEEGDLLAGLDFDLYVERFEQGFTANIGEFKTMKMLKVYWAVIKRVIRAKNKELNAYYVYDEEASTFSLNLGFFTNLEEAENACESVSSPRVECAATELTISR